MSIGKKIVRFLKWSAVVVVALLLLLLAGPLAVSLSGAHQYDSNWRTASRDSAGLAPAPEATPEAVVQVYGARAFNWRGYFALHTWISVKQSDADYYTVYEVTGWRRPVVNARRDVPDRAWYGAAPRLIAELRGDAAEAVIPDLLQAVEDYPFSDRYVAWPGPNSNTFVAWVIRETPGLEVALPSHAVGKDYLGQTVQGSLPGGSGFQFSLGGVAGILAGPAEGFELNLLGLVLGVNPRVPALKLPGLGDWPSGQASAAGARPERDLASDF